MKIDPSNLKPQDVPGIIGCAFIGIGLAIDIPRHPSNFPVPKQYGMVCIGIGAAMLAAGYLLKKFLK